MDNDENFIEDLERERYLLIIKSHLSAPEMKNTFQSYIDEDENHLKELIDEYFDLLYWESRVNDLRGCDDLLEYDNLCDEYIENTNSNKIYSKWERNRPNQWLEQDILHRKQYSILTSKKFKGIYLGLQDIWEKHNKIVHRIN